MRAARVAVAAPALGLTLALGAFDASVAAALPAADCARCATQTASAGFAACSDDCCCVVKPQCCTQPAL